MILKKIVVVFLTLLASSVSAFAASKTSPKEIPMSSKNKQAVERLRQGRDLFDNIRFAEAERAFREAVELDPSFALAQAYLGGLEPGVAGEQRLQKAVSLAASLPESERMLIEAALADRQNNPARSEELRRKIVELVPTDWHAHSDLGGQLVFQRRWDEGAQHLEHAASLNPRAGSVLNLLGYAYLAQRQNDKAIDAFRRYAAVSPQEPNPHDSLGEALMAAGRFDEAERAFSEAIRVSPSFYSAWEGIALSRFLRGQWESGTEALDKAVSAATRPVDRTGLGFEHAWVQFARGDVAGAMRTLDAVERDVQQDRPAIAFVPLSRAAFYNQMDRPLAALQQIELGRQRIAKFPRGNQVGHEAQALLQQLDAETRLGRLADARQTADRLKALARENPQTPAIASNAHFAEGMIALSQGDAKGATVHFAQCLPEDHVCGWRQFVAENMAGDRAAAEATRNRLLSANYRDATLLNTLAKLR